MKTSSGAPILSATGCEFLCETVPASLVTIKDRLLFAQALNSASQPAGHAAAAPAMMRCELQPTVDSAIAGSSTC